MLQCVLTNYEETGQKENKNKSTGPKTVQQMNSTCKLMELSVQSSAARF